MWVASQVLIDIAPATGTTALNHVVRDCVFTNNNITATGFSDGNEMLDILVTNGAGCEVTDNTFYPGIGVSNVKLVTGNMNIISGNKFRNTLNSGIAELPTTARRAVHRTIHLDNEEWTQITNNYWWALGIADPNALYDGYRVTNLIYYQGPTGGTEERGHLVIRGNTMALCTSKTTAWIQIRGCDWAQIEGNFFCFNPLADTIGTGFIVIEDRPVRPATTPPTSRSSPTHPQSWRHEHTPMLGGLHPQGDGREGSRQRLQRVVLRAGDPRRFERWNWCCGQPLVGPRQHVHLAVNNACRNARSDPSQLQQLGAGGCPLRRQHGEAGHGALLGHRAYWEADHEQGHLGYGWVG